MDQKKQRKPKFLEQVKVAYFSISRKEDTKRFIHRTKNNCSTDVVFTVIGSTHMNEGKTIYMSDEVFFDQSRRKGCYIVANELNERHKILLEDIIFLD